ncbi:peptidoglycan-binding protein [Paractinoplanes tereljensis]|uniref:Peptidoglycan-binding protein n=1 Tax=Paractinoplanes tereljensis TaxID=571912 RepID=A0A919TTT1_9ACTN|nr:peptidoglycan-binding protein [Actinoplanes tereljensis]
MLMPAMTITLGGALCGCHGTSPASVAATAPPATATVERRTLSRGEKVGGVLGFGAVFPVPAQNGSGMLTWLPDVGDVLDRGDTVYRVDQVRIPLLFGTIPLYRTLSDGSRGADVRQLESNLAALGYRGFTADGEYSKATVAAVRRWQTDLGRRTTGVVKPGDAVVSAGARRVAELTGTVGTTAAGILLKWTATTRVVDVDLDIDYADLVKPGTAATVELPDGTTTPARVTHVGTPTAKALPVELSVPDRKNLGKVTVTITTETRRDVLAVPVNALVARSGGGYAVVAGTGAVPVTTGLFADGYVEVTGVSEGMAVEVPR